MTPNRKHFMDELDDLNAKVVKMGFEVFSSFQNIIKAIEHKDNELANEIMEKDKYINELEVSINVDAYLLIAKQCPVASDLRRIISALKISNDLERIGDYAVNIAKYLVKTKTFVDRFLDSTISLAKKVLVMLEDILEAFSKENVEKAINVSEFDEKIDKEYKETVKLFIQNAKSDDEEKSEEAMRSILVLKQLERAGDHITNIAENIVYLVNGKRVELD
ncbi:MAG: phosphate signaling complex protein PhoU [Candidatus Izimaplasma sp.]|nr:phosphate signaling complex protein PhoU [Candidatus Izimaplasma bacterium]